MADNYTNTKLSPQNHDPASLNITYGNQRFKIPVNTIACIYKYEGMYFIMDFEELKIPANLKGIDSVFNKTDESEVFQIQDSLLLHKNARIRVLKNHSPLKIEISNHKYSTQISIPRAEHSKFMSWFKSI